VVGTTFDDVLAFPGSTLTCDDNVDGIVNAAVYVVWRKGLGTTYAPDYYNVWRSQFGKTAGTGAAPPSADPLSAAVPEPISLAVLLLGVLILSQRRAVVS
jgi:hypothetical protein